MGAAFSREAHPGLSCQEMVALRHPQWSTADMAAFCGEGAPTATPTYSSGAPFNASVIDAPPFPTQAPDGADVW